MFITVPLRVKRPKAFDPAIMNDIMNRYASSNAMIASDLDGIGETEEETVNEDDTMLCKRVVTKDRRYITQITCFEKGSMDFDDNVDDDGAATTTTRNAMRLPVFGKQKNGGALASLFQFPRRGSLRGTTFAMATAFIKTYILYKITS